MNADLSSNSLEILNHFYNILEINVRKAKCRIENQSLLLTFIKLPTNQVSALLTQSAINSLSFSASEFTSLVQSRYIRKLEEFDKPNEYIITAYGLWEIESHMYGMNINTLLKHIQETKMAFQASGKPLKDIEKIILLSMIALRNFSLDTAMDISNQIYPDYWIEIFNLCADYLSSIHEISNSKWKTTRAGNEHPISYVMRRANELPIKTRHIYKTTGGNRYYLDIDNGDQNPQNRLFSIFSILLKDFRSRDALESFHTFICQLAFGKIVNVSKNFKYINPDWDSIIKEALDELYYRN